MKNFEELQKLSLECLFIATIKEKKCIVCTEAFPEGIENAILSFIEEAYNATGTACSEIKREGLKEEIEKKIPCETYRTFIIKTLDGNYWDLKRKKILDQNKFQIMEKVPFLEFFERDEETA